MAATPATYRFSTVIDPSHPPRITWRPAFPTEPAAASMCAEHAEASALVQNENVAWQELLQANTPTPGEPSSTKRNRLRQPRGSQDRHAIRRFLAKSWKRLTAALRRPHVDPNVDILDDFIIVDWQDTSPTPSK